MNRKTGINATISVTVILFCLTWAGTTRASPQSRATLVTLSKLICEDFNQGHDPTLAARLEAITTKTLEQEIISSQNKISIRGRDMGTRITLATVNGPIFEAQLIRPPARQARTVVTSFENQIRYKSNKPSIQLALNSNCNIEQANEITYTDGESPAFIQPLLETDHHQLIAQGDITWINRELPRLPPIAPQRLRVGVVDSGVNYTLPDIRQSLARADDGSLIGYDYWDGDNTPYDANPARSPFFVQRHGTRTASVIASQAPDIAIVPYRYPRPDMSRMTDLVAHAAANNVRIIGMPLGSNDYKSWTHFEDAANNHPQILFIVSAGNNGRDIDKKGVYPAAMDIKNMLVVTSSNDFVQPAERTNHGRISVDYLVPAEQINAIDYDGSHTTVSGSSYAVSRVVALAARILSNNPDLSTEALMKKIYDLSIRAATGKYVALGYLGDPLANTASVKINQNNDLSSATIATKYTLPISINILDSRWQPAEINQSLEILNRIFQQCSITAKIDQWQTIDGPNYLKDLSTGHALTLRRELGPQELSVFFARDTRMQPQFDAEAFGAGNTSTRPWMKNSLWITYGISDTGIALAHELFHIIANDGRHVTLANNLMHERTADSHTRLTPEQCTQAIANGLQANLLRLTGH